jgi:hypothetical protein
MKQILLTVFIASAAAVVMPRDPHEAGALFVKAGVMLIQLGVTLHDWAAPGYDPGYADEDSPEQQHAGLRAGGILSCVS